MPVGRPQVTPLHVLVPVPVIVKRRRMTLCLGSAVVVVVMLTLMPVVPLARTEAMCPPPSMVIDLVTVTAPKPPSSRASISPAIWVFDIAPANVLHGAVRLQGLTSSPTPDTQVRVACAWAIEAKANVKIASASTLIVSRNLFIWSLLFLSVEVWGWPPVEHGSVPATVAPSFPLLMSNNLPSRKSLIIAS